MSRDALSLLKGSEVVNSNVAGPVSTGKVAAIWTDLDASDLLLKLFLLC
jgi:hypothetical protein